MRLAPIGVFGVMWSREADTESSLSECYLSLGHLQKGSSNTRVESISSSIKSRRSNCARYQGGNLIAAAKFYRVTFRTNILETR